MPTHAGITVQQPRSGESLVAQGEALGMVATPKTKPAQRGDRETHESRTTPTGLRIIPRYASCMSAAPTARHTMRPLCLRTLPRRPVETFGRQPVARCAGSRCFGRPRSRGLRPELALFRLLRRLLLASVAQSTLGALRSARCHVSAAAAWHPYGDLTLARHYRAFVWRVKPRHPSLAGEMPLQWRHVTS